jgi:hypothetical protein
MLQEMTFSSRPFGNYGSHIFATKALFDVMIRGGSTGTVIHRLIVDERARRKTNPLHREAVHIRISLLELCR